MALGTMTIDVHANYGPIIQVLQAQADLARAQSVHHLEIALAYEAKIAEFRELAALADGQPGPDAMEVVVTGDDPTFPDVLYR